MLFIVNQLNFRKVNAVVVRLQDLLKHWSQIRMVEDVSVVVYSKRVSVYAKLVRRDEFFNFCNWYVCSSNPQQLCNADRVIFLVIDRN